jgi:hypothetical protein
MRHLLGNFDHQLVVLQRFARFHDSHDGSLHTELQDSSQ